jgi:hypothetical protein
MEIAPLAVHRLAALDGRMSIVSEEPGRPETSPPWLALEAVPAGAYELDVSTTRPRAGELLVFAGRASAPIQRLPLNPLNRQTVNLVLSVGAPGLVILPDSDLAKVNGRIETRPVRVANDGRFPTAVRSYGTSTVYFLDDNVFLDADGFWVRGGRVAEMVLEGQGRPRAPFTLTLQNGPAENRVVVVAGGSERRETFRASETKTIELAPDATGVVRLSISSLAGFRPSGGVSHGGQYLGIWVRPK